MLTAHRLQLTVCTPAACSHTAAQQEGMLCTAGAGTLLKPSPVSCAQCVLADLQEGMAGRLSPFCLGFAAACCRSLCSQFGTRRCKRCVHAGRTKFSLCVCQRGFYRGVKTATGVLQSLCVPAKGKFLSIRPRQMPVCHRRATLHTVSCDIHIQNLIARKTSYSS